MVVVVFFFSPYTLKSKKLDDTNSERSPFRNYSNEQNKAIIKIGRARGEG